MAQRPESMACIFRFCRMMISPASSIFLIAAFVFAIMLSLAANAFSLLSAWSRRSSIIFRSAVHSSSIVCRALPIS
ncbi:hypothetical protein FB567DRAFT_527251 [Paraphoma chrysanthemicola]|uniref:Uncharacterized protein n=1 Tax=Paraphoma chrysanthemicola TaxID=798071 RepID=A0A8K0R3Y8_9PLEO|nr:hypothetical protein FB567DRAFT_527251 [Paraphoma chrysanthemicola]